MAAKNDGLLRRWHCLLLLISSMECSPPEEVIKCSSENKNCTVTNSYGMFPDRTICKAAQVVYPSSEQQLFTIVASASKNGQKMKVATRYSHSIPKLVCPGGDEGLVISTNYLNRILAIDVSTMTMTVESGVTLREVIEEAAKAGLALPYSPYWWGLTVGGVLSTGAHGSSFWGRGSAVHDHVVAIRIVSAGLPSEGYARIRSLNSEDPEKDAAKVSLGVLGVISRVTLKLQPLFKRSITNLPTNDSDLADKVVSFGYQHEFADITWYPSQHRVVYRIDDRVSSNASGEGHVDFIGFRSTSTLVLATVRTTEETLEATNSASGKCSDSFLTTSALMTSGYGFMNSDSFFTGYPVVGYHNRLQASGGCLDSPKDGLLTACAWDPRVKGEFFHQTTVSIGLSSVSNFILDVQKLRDLAPKAFCGVELYNGILMRYVKASSAHLGKQEDGVDFDITYYRTKDPMVPRLYEDIVEEMEQMAVFKYGGLPHWGKNRNIAFDGAIKKYEKRGEFLEVKRRYDPLGLFSNEWTDQVLGIKGGVSIIREGCALEGLCICSEDLHCAPKQGYFCRPGKVYTDARVCTLLNSKVS